MQVTGMSGSVKCNPAFPESSSEGDRPTAGAPSQTLNSSQTTPQILFSQRDPLLGSRGAKVSASCLRHKNRSR